MGSGRGAGGGRWAARGVLLALAAGLLAAGSASEYDYVSFQSDIGSYQSGRFYTKPPQCVDIPADLRLCHNVGYKKMVLPNLLEHETMAEVKQQASSWVPLLNKNCHIGTQVFLCALFAPVCLDRPIYPCRWLCEAVRDSCEPVMQFFGFYWPEMLKCDKFPEGDVCIAMTPPNATEASRPQGTTVCPPCDNELKSEAIIEHLCASEFGIGFGEEQMRRCVRNPALGPARCPDSLNTHRGDPSRDGSSPASCPGQRGLPRVLPREARGFKENHNKIAPEGLCVCYH
ncbi:secreted frizzled-related protein 1 isoform X3 [Vulpes lagopus]|uniref:secreted frizzled-related protein 1 isoform X3 n=1 Tax=Vulpes lagopus TaxID=494514 RepID=UPI001BC94E88|nr:secreted frizzled-related protein 1 isoform X3 [Vulpes lagopus]